MPTFTRLFVSPWRVTGSLCAVIATVLAALPAHAEYTFTKVIDNVTVDSSGGRYFGTIAPALSGDNVAFWGGYIVNGIATNGVYSRTGGTVRPVATFNGSTVPGGGTFNSFLIPKISGSTTVLDATYTGSTGDRGVFAGDGITLTAIARNGGANSAAPGGGTFNGSFQSAIDGNTTAFVANYTSGSSSTQGIFASTGGVISKVLSVGDTAPGGSSFTFFANFDYGGGAFAFYGNDVNGAGLFLKNGNTISTAMRSGSAVPGGGTFTNLNSLAVSGSTVAFSAPYSGGIGTFGIFANTNGVLTTIATNSASSTPGGIAFNAFSSIAVDGSTVAFSGSYSGSEQQAIYVSKNGSLARVVQVGDALFGSTITALDFTTEGLSNDRLAFDYRLADGTSGIAIASVVPVTVPEAGTMCLVVSAVGVLGLSLRQGRRMGRM